MRNRGKIGVSSEEIKNSLEAETNNLRYEYVPKVREVMEREGVKKIIKDYIDNPAKLFRRVL